MNDRIEIQDLLLRTVVGIDAKERKDRQDVVLDIVLYTDTWATSATDQTNADTNINHRAICDAVIRSVENSDFRLISTLAATVAQTCLSDQLVTEVEVTAKQPQALPFAGCVAATIRRKREDRGLAAN